jgi:AraC-like DNA-binding protein
MTHRGMSGWRDLGHHAAAFILEGRGSYEDEAGTRHRIVPGCVVFSFPGLRHFYRPAPGTEWTEFYLIFDGPVIELWESQGLIQRHQPVLGGLDPVEVWARRFESVPGPSGTLGTTPSLVEICRLQALLAEIVCHRSGTDGSGDEAWLDRAQALLESDRHRQTSVEQLATLLGLAPHAFRRKFGQLAGISPARYRAVRTIDRACELMQSTDLLDKQIAEQLGFCDEYYFSRRFREITGRSPTEFRSILPPSKR